MYEEKGDFYCTTFMTCFMTFFGQFQPKFALL